MKHNAEEMTLILHSGRFVSQRAQMVLFAPISCDLHEFGSKIWSNGKWNCGVSSRMVLPNHREIEMVFLCCFLSGEMQIVD